MQIAVTGSSGLIGTALVTALRQDGHRVLRVVRATPSGADEISWDPATGRLDPADLTGTETVIHLAGESIGRGRWSAAQKRRLVTSRVDSTRLLAQTMAAMDGGPHALLSASGINYYGDRGDEILHSDSGAGSGFMASLCKAWEAAAEPAREADLRVVHLRTGIVLAPEGGVLQPQLPIFKLGLGAKLGPGTQYVSWISLDDIVGVYRHLAVGSELHGAVTAVSPEPVTNADFTRVLARVLGRPAVVPFVPAPALKLVLGDIAEELLLASQRAVPDRLLGDGYTFGQPDLEGALRHVLGRPA